MTEEIQRMLIWFVQAKATDESTVKSVAVKWLLTW